MRCEIYWSVAFVAPAEGFTVMCISWERSQMTMRPLERESGKKVLKKIAAIWIASLLLELPHGLSYKHSEDAPSYLKCLSVINLALTLLLF